MCCMHGHVQHSTAQHTRCPVKHSTHMGPRALEKARQHGGRVCACCMHGAAGGEKNVFWSGIVPGSLLWLHNIIRPPWRAQKGLCEEGHSTAAGVLRCAQRAGHVGTRVCGLLLGLLSLLVPVCLFHPGVCHPWGHAGPRLLQISLHQARELLAAAACCLCLSAAGWVGAAIPLQAIYKHAGLPALRAQHVVRGTAGCCLLAAAHGTHWCVPVGAWGAWFACTRVGGCCGDTHSGAGPILAALPAGSLVHTAGWLEGFRFAP